MARYRVKGGLPILGATGLIGWHGSRVMHAGRKVPLCRYLEAYCSHSFFHKDCSHAHARLRVPIVLPLLPIFLIGLFPMLLLSLLGPAGLVILGILVACAGLTDILDASGTFSEQIIVHGYARGSERAGQRTALHSEVRFASTMIACGGALAVAGIGGLFIS
ncbi:hypothetical protein [Bradyrhizobium archetypum]|uniref:hypothetical protein n=1 Tax=Bradyrhizobium archetypum TaxID=2721160 RepID=UPI001F3ADC7A|nr:hypothetical protein [Bradyrhizobium archetypum]